MPKENFNSGFGLDQINKEENVEKSREYMQSVVSRIQDIYIGYAEEYLPEGSSLRSDIVRFYSDKERLLTELSNVYRNDSTEKIDAEIEALKQYHADKDNFLNFVVTRNYSVSE